MDGGDDRFVWGRSEELGKEGRRNECEGNSRIYQHTFESKRPLSFAHVFFFAGIRKPIVHGFVGEQPPFVIKVQC